MMCRGAGGYWRTYQAQDLATPEAFEDNPSLVWEFYSYRREVMVSKVLYIAQSHIKALITCLDKEEMTSTAAEPRIL